MSLISDALKMAQRERAGRAQAGKDPEPMLDGFFPYVASEPTRSRSRLVPIVGISAAAIVLLGITAFLMWPRGQKVVPRDSRVPAVLPPSPTTAQVPAVAPSSATSDTRPIADAGIAASQPLSSRMPQVERPGISASPPPTGTAPRTIEPAAPRVDPPVAVNDPIPRATTPRSGGVPPASRVDYEAQATVLFNAGDLVGARGKFELATRYAPSARAWTNYGVTLQRLGDYAGAAAAYQSAIGIDPNYLEAWLYQGRLAADRGDNNRAVPLFERARAINPRHADVNVELARLAYDAKNYTEARRFAEDAARSAPSNARAHWYLAVASDGLRDVEGAIRGYTAYLQTVGSGAEQAQFVGWARQQLAALKGKP